MENPLTRVEASTLYLSVGWITAGELTEPQP